MNKSFQPRMGFNFHLTFFLFFIIPIFSFGQISINLSKSDPTCFGYSNGTVTVQVSNGKSPYTYNWSNGANSSQISGLNSGTYSVTVTDANGIKANASATLTQPANLSVSHTFANPCVNGQTNLNINGGTPPYTYAWSNGNTSQNPLLTAGAYTVTVTDKNNCAVNYWLNVPAILDITNIKIVGLRCFGDCDASVESIITGGTAPFSFLWNNGVTTQVNPNLPAGTYSVTVKDANNCQVVKSTTVTNPIAIVVNVSKVNPSCTTGGNNKGSATASASGGKAPLIYEWNNGANGPTITGLNPGTYTVTVTDANGCKKTESVSLTSATTYTITASTASNASCGTNNGSATVSINGGTGPFTYAWNNGKNTQTITNIAPGIYNVTVTDGAGCQATSSTTVTTTGNLNITINKTDAACGIANGAATIVVNSGTAPYTYTWSTGNATNAITGLNAGTYSVTVKDATGCVTIQSITIGQGNSLTINVDVTNVSCFGLSNGVATAMIVGGSAPYTYNWSNGSKTPSVNGLPFGNYSVTVTDAAGCTSNKQFTVSQPSAIGITINITNPNCNSGKGSMTANVTGGTAPYTYIWSNAGNATTISNLSAGSYSVTVTDSKNCTTNSSGQISVPTDISLSFNSTNAACVLKNGKISITATGGSGGTYTYTWSNGATSANLTGLDAGTYSVTVTDAKGCTKIGSATITSSSSNFTCNVLTNRTITVIGANDGELEVESTATGTVTYKWSNTKTTKIINGLSPGTYTVTVTDASGCNTTCTTTLVNPPPCNNVTDPGSITGDQIYCPGQPITTIEEVTPAVGGSNTLNYIWMQSPSRVATTSSIWQVIPFANGPSYTPPQNLTDTVYYVRCARRQYCADVLETNIVAKIPAVISKLTTNRTKACFNKSTTFEAFDNGNGASYIWNFGLNANPKTVTGRVASTTFNQLGGQSISIQFFKNGCVATKTFIVNVSNDVDCGTGRIININVNILAEEKMDLNWTTINDDNGSIFEVQKSNDGENFEQMGYMLGQSNLLNNYHFTDYKPYLGRNYYRIKLKNTDGTFEYSDIASGMKYNGSEPYALYPNPASNVVNFDLMQIVNTNNFVIEIVNTQGKLIKSFENMNPNGHQKLDISDLVPGAYFIHAKIDGKLEKSMKLFKVIR